MHEGHSTRIQIIEPHGFCSGVQAALEKVQCALQMHAPHTLYALHPLVHNEEAHRALCQQGLQLKKTLDDIPPGASVLISAHGASQAFRMRAQAHGLHLVDATCPFVEHLHAFVRACAATRANLLILGHATHIEVQGLVDEMPPGRVFVVSHLEDLARIPFSVHEPLQAVCQTTFDARLREDLLTALHARFAHLDRARVNHVCPSTQRRQDAVRKMIERASSSAVGVIVVGSATSSNTCRLVETAHRAGAQAWCVQTPEQVRALPLKDLAQIGLTSGASTPEKLFQEIKNALF